VTSDLINFYRGQGPDAAGRSIDEIWAWDHKRLEMVHDFVQWLFPLPEPSRFNPEAPLLSAADIAVFRTDAALQARALRSFDVMLKFFALERTAGGVTRTADFAGGAHWLQPLNHNHLRLTRIMLFLRHVGLTREADALLTCLLDIAATAGRGTVADRTLQFWRATKDA